MYGSLQYIKFIVTLIVSALKYKYPCQVAGQRAHVCTKY